MTLTDLLPADPDADSLFEAFSAWTAERGLELYPAQEEAHDRSGLRGERDPVDTDGLG